MKNSFTVSKTLQALLKQLTYNILYLNFIFFYNGILAFSPWDATIKDKGFVIRCVFLTGSMCICISRQYPAVDAVTYLQILLALPFKIPFPHI
jgi:hypothetical protein